MGICPAHGNLDTSLRDLEVSCGSADRGHPGQGGSGVVLSSSCPLVVTCFSFFAFGCFNFKISFAEA